MKWSRTQSPASLGWSHTAAPFPWLHDFYLLSSKRSQKPLSDSLGSHAPSALSARGRAARSCWGVKSLPPWPQEGVWVPCSSPPPTSCPRARGSAASPLGAAVSGAGAAAVLPAPFTPRWPRATRGWSLGGQPRGSPAAGPPVIRGGSAAPRGQRRPSGSHRENPRGVRTCLKYFIATSYGPLILPAAGLLRVNTKPLYS